MPRFDLQVFCEVVQKHKLTFIHIVPPIVTLLAKSPIVTNYDFSSVRVIFSAAAPLSAELGVEVSKKLKCVVKEGYGMTECSTGAFIQNTYNVRPGTVGTLFAGMKAKVVDEQGNGNVIN
jgi:acyl-coenzyme A synthetase/AMP-(fatty) acid ligase